MATIIEPLPTIFRSDGFDFRQLQRQGNIVLLAKKKSNHLNLSHFEVKGCNRAITPRRTLGTHCLTGS